MEVPRTPSPTPALNPQDEGVNSEAEEAEEPTEAPVRKPVYVAADGRAFYEEDMEEMIKKHAEATSSASSGASSSSSPPPSGFRMLAIADSGFGCVNLVVAGAKLGICFICSVKTAHKRFPKDYLTSLLKDAPSGKWALAETEVEGVSVMAAAYKYNSSRILFFTWPQGAAECVQGEPYIATFVDSSGNKCEREIQRLCVLSRYFAYSNVVDVHDQMRQAILDLEYTWVTQNCWFRLFTTLLGMTVTDTYLIVKSSVHEDHCEKNIPFIDFADLLAFELLHYEDEVDSGRPRAPRRSLGVPAPAVDPVDEAAVSLLPPNRHRLECYGMNQGPKGQYAVQKTCVVCGDKATTYCAAEQCGKKVAICREGTSKKKLCLQTHRHNCLEGAEVEFVDGTLKSAKKVRSV